MWWKIFSDKNRSAVKLWVVNRFFSRRVEPSEESCDGHLGMRCHHSISKSDDEQGVFLSASSVDYQTSSPCPFCDARSIPKPQVHFAITLLSFKSICHMRGLNLIPALAPWQPSASWGRRLPPWQVFFHATLPIATHPIWLNGVSLCSGTHNDMCFSSALLLLHRRSEGKSQSRRREQNQ